VKRLPILARNPRRFPWRIGVWIGAVRAGPTTAERQWGGAWRRESADRSTSEFPDGQRALS